MKDCPHQLISMIKDGFYCDFKLKFQSQVDTWKRLRILFFFHCVHVMNFSCVQLKLYEELMKCR
mgnify:CR=1 FL=1